MLLKRLSDAVADGDQILAVLRGSAINNDGAQKVGFLAPSVGGQARVISEALAVAGVSAADVSFVEAHGTGTAIGDPIEVKALTQAFRESTDKRGYCALGSVKANIGHLGEAAGMAAFIKTVMALTHKQIPPLVNFTRPSSALDLPETPFFINTALQAWAGPSPRVAGITALGAGGTNAHVLIEEAPAAPASSSSSSSPPRPTELVLLSAKSAAALDQATKNLTAYLGPAGRLHLSLTSPTRWPSVARPSPTGGSWSAATGRMSRLRSPSAPPHGFSPTAPCEARPPSSSCSRAAAPSTPGWGPSSTSTSRATGRSSIRAPRT